MLSLILPFITSWLPSIGKSLVDGYKAKLDASNTSERVAADLAGRELALEQRERELATQVIIAEEGRWWTALPRTVIAGSFAVYVAKCVVWDKVLSLGSTDPLGGDIAIWGGWVLAFYFGGRTLEKVARILKR
ncbi:MAG: hypothetical protein WA418_14390 [Bradyrhizobium sp.]